MSAESLMPAGPTIERILARNAGLITDAELRELFLLDLLCDGRIAAGVAAVLFGAPPEKT